jgi:hypothetical protein
MQEGDIEQQFQRMRKEIETTVSRIKQAKIDLTAAIDKLSIELHALRLAVERYHPGMSKSYPKLREEARARNRKTRRIRDPAQ